jgi:kinesin family protein C2/C3
MNNKYIYDTNINQEKQLNKNNPNSNTNFNINNQRFSSDFLISPFKEEQSPSNNIPKNSNKLIQQNIESKILTKSDLKDSNNINKINDNNNDINKLQELLESKKIINTLCSIKTSTSQNMNFEEIKLLPNLFLDLQEALKKSNQNVLELKETIKEKINAEKKFKIKIKQLENENKEIKNLKKILEEENNELKNNQNFLKNENKEIKQKFNYDCDLQNKFNEIKILNNDLLLKIEKLESKIIKYKNNINILQSQINNLNEKNEKDNINYMNKLKDMKTELKNQLNEKMNFIKEINELKISLNKKNKENQKLKEELNTSEKMKEKFEHLFNEYRIINKENEELNAELNERNNKKEIIENINDKYEKEEFDLKSQINLWKNNFLLITKYKLYNYDIKNIKNIEKLLNIEQKYIINAPSEFSKVSEKILNYSKSLIEEVNYNTINLKEMKEELTKEQEINNKLNENLEKEKILRRKIHNRYMYLRGNMRIMCRLRPFLINEIKNKKSNMETISINNDTILIQELNKTPKMFEYDYVFDEQSTQEDIYEEVSLLIQSMIHGNNICIMSYGQTCTGKTYTIQGNNNNKGIASRAVKEIFEIIDNLIKKNNLQKNRNNFENGYSPSQVRNTSYFIKAKINMTIIEIYNEQIFNLLEESTPKLNIFEDAQGNLIIPDLSPINISNYDEANKLFILSEKFRHTSSTEFNERSSRSHCIFTFNIKLTNNDNNIIRSTLHVIDLAGSERITKAQSNNEKIKKEALSINLSLHSLSNVLFAIANKSGHIPYRDSKLTHFLKDSLNDNYNIMLLLHISPNIKDLSETISTLQFGERIIKLCRHKTGKEKMNLVNNNCKKILTENNNENDNDNDNISCNNKFVEDD